MKQLLKMYILLLCAAVTMSACTDDNTVENQTQGDRGATVNFNVSSAQDEMFLQQQTAPVTRSAVLSRLGDEGLTLEDLATHRHAVQGATDLCMIETTIEGVNPVLPSADTRAQVKTGIDGTFTSLGYRSTTPGFLPDKPDWFYNAPTNANGTLVTPLQWAWTHRYGRFYAVYPEAKSENKITLSPATHSGTPYVEFEAEQDVKNQKDLMTACSGEVKYETRGIAPQTNLKFKHALTAVRFAVGQNLSWNKRITKVEIKNACSKGKYMLPTQYGGAGTWVAGSLTDRKDFVLDVATSPIDLKQNPNTVIMGNPTDNYTFYMIPQDLTGITVVVTLEDKDPAHPSPAPNTITIPLTGKSQWKPGTSKLYKLSQNNSDWTYHLTVTQQPAPAAYDATQTGTYGISSYRQAPDGTQKAVAWKVKEYSFDDGATWVKTIPANSWFKGLSLSEGGKNPNLIGEEQGTATLTKDVTDLLAERNAKLKLNPKGSISNPYDLSMHDVTGNLRPSRSTANCYVISAPGHYRIPLVYGNAIENGATNANSYISHAPTGTPNEQYVLRNFKDHNNQAITDPWIEKTNGGANSGVDGAEVVWADAANLVHSPSISHVGSDAFLDFEVKANDIQSGNAVVAVKKGNTIVWSWHLWFAPKDVLDKIKVTNHQNKDYYFTKESLGWKPTQWSGTTYDKARTVKVKVVQTVKNGGIAQETVINITQNPGSVKKGATTLYQFGRKDAFPGVETSKLAANSHFTENAGDNMSIMNGIQHPGNFYIWGSNWQNNYGYYNLWSADNTVTGGYNQGNDNSVVKTVYDPCPAGFKMPANNAFTGFTANGQNSGTMNVDGTDNWQTYQNNFGHNFWTNNSKTATIYFPASGYRIGCSGGSLNGVGSNGYSWPAVPSNTYFGCHLTFFLGVVLPLDNLYIRTCGFAARPVADE